MEHALLVLIGVIIFVLIATLGSKLADYQEDLDTLNSQDIIDKCDRENQQKRDG